MLVCVCVCVCVCVTSRIEYLVFNSNTYAQRLTYLRRTHERLDIARKRQTEYEQRKKVRLSTYSPIPNDPFSRPRL